MATETVRLTELSHGAGCACKLPAGSLREVLAGMPQASSSQLMVGHESLDDAAVWRISDELAVVQTIDFFTPLVDAGADPQSLIVEAPDGPRRCAPHPMPFV